MDKIENSHQVRDKIRDLKYLLIDFTVPIYILEHNTLNFKITKSMLGTLGFQNVTHFRDPADFFETLLASEEYLVSISNLNDPNLNGVEYLKELGNQGLKERVKPILLTPKKIPKVSEFLAQICDYQEVLKPLDRSRFKEAIYNICIEMI